MGEHIDVQLRSGGSVHMDIDANLLSLSIEDFEFVKGIYSLLTEYADLKVVRVERPKPAGGVSPHPRRLRRLPSPPPTRSTGTTRWPSWPPTPSWSARTSVRPCRARVSCRPA